MEAYYSIIQKENEYRILLTSVNTVFHFIARDIHSDIVELKKYIIKYLAETDWEQWEKNDC